MTMIEYLARGMSASIEIQRDVITIMNFLQIIKRFL